MNAMKNELFLQLIDAGMEAGLERVAREDALRDFAKELPLHVREVAHQSLKASLAVALRQPVIDALNAADELATRQVLARTAADAGRKAAGALITDGLPVVVATLVECGVEAGLEHARSQLALWRPLVDAMRGEFPEHAEAVAVAALRAGLINDLIPKLLTLYTVAPDDVSTAEHIDNAQQAGRAAVPQLILHGLES